MNMYGLSLQLHHELNDAKKDDLVLVAMYYRSISTTDETGVGKFHLQYKSV